MAEEIKLTDPSIPELTDVSPGDRLYIVDVSDTTDGPAGTSKYITPENLVKAPVPDLNKFIVRPTLSIEAYSIDVSSGEWMINGVNYNNAGASFTVNIPATGYTRLDLIVADASGDYVRIQGVPSLTNPASPSLPLNSLLVSILTVSDSSVTETPLTSISDLISSDADNLIELGSDGKLWSGGGGSSTPDATASVKGKIKLAGDLGGTADAPTVPGLADKQDLSEKNASDGYVGLSGFQIAIKNHLNTITSFFANYNTGGSRTYTFPDKSMTVAGTDDIPDISGKEDSSNKVTTFTGNETSTTKIPVVKAIIDYFTTSRIKTLLGQASASVDGWLSSTDWSTFNNKQNALGYTPENTSNKSTSTADSASSVKFPVWSAIVSYFDASRIRTILGITTLSGSNTGDQDLSGLMVKANNGSDIVNIATFRANLGVDKLTQNGNSNYSILSTDKAVVTSATLTAPRTWTLPAANSVNAGYEIIVADLFGGVSSTNTLIIARAGSDTINSATSVTIGAQYGMRRLFSDGVSKWTFDGGVMRISDYIGTTLTANVIVATDSNAKLQPLPTSTYPSLTELSYVKGLTSSAQTQLDAKQALTTATTGAVISFATPQIYNSVASPTASNITDDLTGAKIGVVQKIYSNKSSAPTFPAGWVKLGSGSYVNSSLNVIYAEWVSGSRVEYWIVQ